MSNQEVLTIITSPIQPGSLEKINEIVIKDSGSRYVLKIPGLGLFLALLSGLVFSFATLTVEFTPNIEPAFNVLFRGLIELVFYGLIALGKGHPLQGVAGERKALLCRALFGFSSFTLCFYALRLTSFGNVNTVIFSSSVFVSLLAWLVLGEKCGWIQIGSVCFAIVGVVIIGRPPFIFGDGKNSGNVGNDLIGVCLALLACLSSATTFVSIRKLKLTPTPVVIAWLGYFCFIGGLLIMFFFEFCLSRNVGFPSTLGDYMFCTLNGILGLIAQFLLMWCLKLEEAGIVSLIRTFDIVIAFVLQSIFLKQIILDTSIYGAIIIVFSILACCLRRLYVANPDRFKIIGRVLLRLKIRKASQTLEINPR